MTLDIIEKQRASLEADTSLSDEERSLRTEQLGQATKWLGLIGEYESRAAECRAEIASAPVDIELAKVQVPSKEYAMPQLTANVTLAQLERYQREANDGRRDVAAERCTRSDIWNRSQSRCFS